MSDKKFDPKKLAKLNNPQRLVDIPPEYIQSKLNIKESKTIVEIGAGTAFFSVAFLKQFNPSKVFACDISDSMIDWMQKNISPDYPSIIPIKNRESSVPLDDHTADLVFMIALHHELDNPALILDEACRLLGPGGKVLIVDWKKEEMPQGPPLTIRCRPETIENQLIKSNFKEIQIFKELPKHFVIVGRKPEGD